ncbi:MAG: DUF1629 domain-containing protein [Pseudomonadota bacterium]|nr:DUF1629 domain-containing protein [Pseudomonadota bacterium]
MTDQTAIPVTYYHTPPKGRFYTIETDIRGGGKGHGLEIANENKLCAPGRIVMMPPNGNPDQYPEKPHLVHDPKSGRMPRDLEGLAGIWIVSEQAKQVFESVDPEGFAFTACDFTLSDGSPGPQRYLCGILRTLDALDEEASRLKIKVGDYVNGKYYSLAGGASLVFKEDVVGSAHIFQTPYSGETFCTRTFRDAVKAAGLTGVWLTDAAKC